VALVRAPAVGDYLAHGGMLVEVLGINDSGEYEVEDAKTGTILSVPVHELQTWRLVREAAKLDDGPVAA